MCKIKAPAQGSQVTTMSDRAQALCHPIARVGRVGAPWVPRGCTDAHTDARTCGTIGRVPVGRKWAISTVHAPAFCSTSVHITEGRPLTN